MLGMRQNGKIVSGFVIEELALSIIGSNTR